MITHLLVLIVGIAVGMVIGVIVYAVGDRYAERSTKADRY